MLATSGSVYGLDDSADTFPNIWSLQFFSC